ncbi:MAG: LysM domain-containing protein, partial [Gammaproteobacteria bacterium]
MPDKKTLSLLLAALLMSMVAVAQDAVELNPDHPTRYIVKRGDTLWDISTQFLVEPWRWPEIWQTNPQVRNPHLIFPGDELALFYRDGQPVVQLTRR